MEIIKKLSEIQKNLVANKSQYNTFGKYSYRSCEDILESVKPLLGDMVLVISDEIESICDRVYVTATATLRLGKDELSSTASAREPLAQKGMNEAQITGSASSYARKYALNGLFCIDDSKDADSLNAHDKTPVKQLRENNTKLVDEALKYLGLRDGVDSITDSVEKKIESMTKDQLTKQIAKLKDDLAIKDVKY